MQACPFRHGLATVYRLFAFPVPALCPHRAGLVDNFVSKLVGEISGKIQETPLWDSDGKLNYEKNQLLAINIS